MNQLLCRQAPTWRAWLLLLIGLLSSGWTLTLPAAPAATSADALLGDLGLAPTKPHFLPAEQAFVLQTRQEGAHLRVQLTLADGYYLYRDKLSWQVSGGQLGEVALPAGERHEDEFFGQTQVFYQAVSFTIPLLAVPTGAQLTLGYQGCTEGLCYPPVSQTIPLQAVAAQSPTAEGTPANQVRANTPEPTRGVTDRLADQVQQALNSGTWAAAGIFLLLGLGLAFTPCMLPMYPILSAIILGRGSLSVGRALALSLAYVQGMALTYTLVGLAVAALGASLQAWLQHPLVLTLFSLLFVLLAAAMFGAFELQLPANLQLRLHRLAGRSSAGSLPGVFTMGAISALICSPCTTAPLSGALLYVAQSGDRLLGATVLYALALGMGIPLLLLGTLGPRWLPRHGLWMQRVKVLFGFLLLSVPIILLARLLPEPLIRAAWLLLLICSLGYLLLALLPRSRLRLASLLLLPLLVWFGWQQLAPTTQALNFRAVASLGELQQELAAARARKQPVMVDFYADWCVACKQIDAETFSNAKVQAGLTPYLLLRADVTAPGKAQQELLQAMSIPGLPAILFFGQPPHPLARIDGFQPPEQFLDTLPNCQPDHC